MAIVKGEKRGRPGKWLADYRDGAGVRHWRTFDTKREAEDFLDQERPRTRQDTGRARMPARICVKDYAEHWLKEGVDQWPKLKPATKFHYRRIMERFWAPRIGHVQLRRLQRETIRDVLLAELGKKRAPNTVTLYLAVITKMLRWAVREDHVLTLNPAAELAKPLGLTRDELRVIEEALTFDREDLTRLLGATRDVAPRYAGIFFLMARTGLRPSEARALQWPDYNGSRQVLQIRRTFGLRDILGAPKTRKGRRDVDVTPQLADLLRRQRKAQAEAKLAGRLPELPEFIFTEPDGRPLDRRTFERTFERVLVQAGLPLHHTPKSLRHTYASLLLSAGKSPAYIASQLGHSSSSFTERVYARWIPTTTPAVHALDDAADFSPAALSGSKTAGFGSSTAANPATVQAIG